VIVQSLEFPRIVLAFLEFHRNGALNFLEFPFSPSPESGLFNRLLAMCGKKSLFAILSC